MPRLAKPRSRVPDVPDRHPGAKVGHQAVEHPSGTYIRVYRDLVSPVARIRTTPVGNAPETDRDPGSALLARVTLPGTGR
jgi:hypothetical protein